MSLKMGRRKHDTLRIRKRVPPGAAPGALVADPNAKRPEIRVIAYSQDAVEERKIDDPRDIEPILNQWPVVWVDVDGLADMHVIHEFGRLFGLHPLALEDVINTHQRPKVEDYTDHLYIVTRMPLTVGQFQTEQVSLFLGSNFVLTFQELPGDCLDPLRKRIHAPGGRLRASGADYLAYGILDAVIDGYFPALEACSERLEALEDEIIERPSNDSLARLFQIRRDLLVMRRGIWPQREAMNELLRNPHAPISEETRLFFRDCHDHVIQIVDLVETYRELAGGLMDAYLSSVGNRMNQIMKVLTIISTIFIPLTFIAGVYGMNFYPDTSPWNMPELRWKWGYLACLLLMAVVALALLWNFRRRGWLTRDDSRSGQSLTPRTRSTDR